MRKMAVNNDKDLDLRISEKNDVLLFAEDLVDYTLSPHGSRYDLKWKPTVFRNDIYNTYVPIIRRTINLIEYALEVDHAFLDGKMKRANLFNSNSYERFDKILAAKYFPEGFDAKYFFLYCVNLSIMAVYFDGEGSCGARDLAKQYMYRFLQKYDVLVGGWSAICKFAEYFVQMLRYALYGLTLLFDSGLVSDDDDDDVPQDQEQEEVNNEEVNNDESSSSPSDEECFPTGDATIDIRFQRECAYLRIKSYLRKYADCYSESASQIGLCSLREPEIPGLNFDDLINIISDFKMKTNLLWKEVKLIDKSASE